MVDLLLRDARLLNQGISDIAIETGKIAAVGPRLDLDASQEIELDGMAVTAGLVNAHLHLDKALTAQDLAWEEGTFQESIDLTLHLRRAYSQEDLLGRGRQVLESVITHGTTALRAFADVGTVGGLEPARAVLALKDEWAGLLDVQVVAFPQEGILRDPGADRLMEEAMELGCDVVGCFPWFELSQRQAGEHIDFCLELAARIDRDVHAFVDDEPIAPSRRDLEQLALATLEAGYQGRVTVSHACGLASYDDFSADRLIRLVGEAEISVCANAHVSLVSKCQHAPEPIPRGITRVRELKAHGVNVICAQDDIADPYYAFGRGDMIEVASFLAHTAHLYRQADAQYVLDAVTEGSARAMRLPDYGLTEGCRADLVVYEQGTTATEILRLQPARRYVIKSGRVVAETKTESHVHRS